MVRLQKFLADCGICSRRKAEEHILLGDVKVNGKIISELGTKIDENKDKVYFKDKLIKLEQKKVYIMLNKPEGCVTTVKEQFDRKIVFDYINIKERVVPVGRLDYDTSGLLILTNDGDLTYKLTHPKHNVKKIYIAKVYGVPSKEKLEKFKTGVIIDGYKTAPADIKILEKNDKYSILKIIITEGKNRQVRKMCEAIGHKVVSLKRIAIEKISIGNLKIGEYRYLTKDEISYLKKICEKINN
ncbi:pseudouridine synthase [[Clostridium] colinum]|uniref:pseudouridine synthase n=1 Tax=[Clostridium] colinum TaxID=36835 RepID=UPI002023FDB1|nr:pseudouridine synthase [[Clostridium] colinum]